MSDAQKQIRLFTWWQGVLIVLAAAGGVGINAYRTWRTEGGLDMSWFIAAAVALAAFVVIYRYMTRHANRPGREV